MRIVPCQTNHGDGHGWNTDISVGGAAGSSTCANVCATAALVNVTAIKGQAYYSKEESEDFAKA